MLLLKTNIFFLSDHQGFKLVWFEFPSVLDTLLIPLNLFQPRISLKSNIFSSFPGVSTHFHPFEV